MKPEPIIFNYNKSIPTLPAIELKINPESLTLNWKKIITRARTKSRIVSFYWGQEPVNFTYRGQTGNVYPKQELVSQLRNQRKSIENDIISHSQLSDQKRLELAKVTQSISLASGNEELVSELELESELLQTSIEVDTASINALSDSLDALPDKTHTELIELSPKYQALKRLEELFEASQDVTTLMKVQYRHYIFEGYFETFSFTDDGINPWNWIYNISFTVLKWDRQYSENFPKEHILVKD